MPFAEQQKLSLQIQAFNDLNHPQFGAPNAKRHRAHSRRSAIPIWITAKCNWWQSISFKNFFETNLGGPRFCRGPFFRGTIGTEVPLIPIWRFAMERQTRRGLLKGAAASAVAAGGVMIAGKASHKLRENWRRERKGQAGRSEAGNSKAIYRRHGLRQPALCCL